MDNCQDYQITREPRELINRYCNGKDPANVSVGLRPSGTIHLGNMATMALAGYLSAEIGPHLSDLNLTICDLDMPDIRDWCVKENGYMRYFANIPDRSECHGSLLDHARECIERFAMGLEKELRIKSKVKLLSEVQKDPGFREGLKKVLDADLMQTLNETVQKGRVLVYPLCPRCHTSKPSANEYREGKVLTECTNPMCSQEQFEVDVLDPNFDLAVHYLIDPIRDCWVPPHSSIHVFGGDYLSECSSNLSKLMKIIEVMKASQGKVPDFLVGPTFYSHDGTKMSKSKENGLTFEKLRGFFGDTDVVPRILDVIRWIDSEGIKVVDFTIVKDRLFSRQRPI